MRRIGRSIKIESQTKTNVNNFMEDNMKAKLAHRISELALDVSRLIRSDMAEETIVEITMILDGLSECQDILNKIKECSCDE